MLYPTSKSRRAAALACACVALGLFAVAPVAMAQ